MQWCKLFNWFINSKNYYIGGTNMFSLDLIVNPLVLLLYPPVTVVVGIILAAIIIIAVIIKKRRG